MVVTAIICTHNRSEVLQDCLLSLERQSLSEDQYEILIVDNASTDSTASIAQAWASKRPNRKYIFEETVGLARARNTGLAASSGAVVAYTDDDVLVADDWLERIGDRFSSLGHEVGGLGGEIDPLFEAPRPSWLTDDLLHFLSINLGWSETPRLMTDVEWICEANCAYRTEVLNRYGGFPEHLGRKGDLLLSGENFVNEMMKKDGIQFYFDPTIRVTHRIPPSRLTKEWMRRRMFWAGVTAARLPEEARRLGYDHPHWPMLRPPGDASEWFNVLNDEAPDSNFSEACSRIAHVGYLLEVSKIVSGR